MRQPKVGGRKQAECLGLVEQQWEVAAQALASLVVCLGVEDWPLGAETGGVRVHRLA